MEQAIRTARTAKTARPVTSTSGRYVRLGTVSETVFSIYINTDICVYLAFILVSKKITFPTSVLVVEGQGR